MIDIRDRSIGANSPGLRGNVTGKVTAIDVEGNVFFDVNCAAHGRRAEAYRSIAQCAVVVEKAIFDLDQPLGRSPRRGAINRAANITGVVIFEHTVSYLQLCIVAVDAAARSVRAVAG